MMEIGFFQDNASMIEAESAAGGLETGAGERGRVRLRREIIDVFTRQVLTQPDREARREAARDIGFSASCIRSHFHNLQGLYRAAVDRLGLDKVGPGGRDTAGDRAARIERHVAIRATAWEELLPYWRSVRQLETTDPALARALARAQDRRSAALVEFYAADLGMLPASAGQVTALMLDVATDLAVWGMLREIEGVPFEDACAGWRAIVGRLLPRPQT